MTKPNHIPVLLQEVVKNALPENGKVFVDATFALGGHTNAILEKYPQIQTVVAIDQDEQILKHSLNTCTDNRVQRFHSQASELPQILSLANIHKADGILLDLGVSSFQLDTADRGFSFTNPGKLDMRMDSTQSLDAIKVVNEYEQSKLIEIFRKYGEERFAKRIAQFIIKERESNPIITTDHLASIVKKAIPAKFSANKSTHPATKVFQAIRIEVNDELQELQSFLDIAIDCLNPNGHLSIISFHSLEDRIVKKHFKLLEQGCKCPGNFPVCVCNNKPAAKSLNKKAIFAQESEIANNPRSRSARLRSLKKL